MVLLLASSEYLRSDIGLMWEVRRCFEDLARVWNTPGQSLAVCLMKTPLVFARSIFLGCLNFVFEIVKVAMAPVFTFLNLITFLAQSARGPLLLLGNVLDGIGDGVVRTVTPVGVAHHQD